MVYSIKSLLKVNSSKMAVIKSLLEMNSSANTFYSLLLLEMNSSFAFITIENE